VPSCPAWLHDSHWPAHAVLQQMPLTQCPLSHWAAEPHAAPGGSFGVQTPPEQYSVPAQSPSAVHPPSHRMPALSQVKMPQGWSWSGPQEPLPWHVAASLATPSAQEAARQLVPSG
jgi:hypothetical protein